MLILMIEYLWYIEAQLYIFVVSEEL